MTDLAIRLMTQGYDAVTRDRAGRTSGDPDTYASRLLGRRAVVLRGAAGARRFYDQDLVSRKGAVPPPLGFLLFGRNAMHLHDGEEHRRRKDLFLRLLDADAVEPVVTAALAQLEKEAATWGDGTVVDLYDVLVRAYGTAVIAWAGIDVPPAESTRMSLELARIVDGFGGSPVAYGRAWLGRRRAEGWARELLSETRAGVRRPQPGSVLAELAAADRLDLHTAAVELLNVLRPTVAVAWLGAAAAAQLARTPELAAQVAQDPETATAFAHEIRRLTPFAPALAGRARRESEHDGVRIRRGDRLVLDVWGTDMHRDTWPAAASPDPARFAGRDPGPYEVLPQGGGPMEGHRCPGEPLTVRLLTETARLVARHRPGPGDPPPQAGARVPPHPPRRQSLGLPELRATT